MKKLFALLLALLIILCSIAAIAEGKLTVTSMNVIKHGKDSGLFVARVENIGDEPIIFYDGKLEIFSDDYEILVSDYVSSCPYYIYLKPGEYTYCRQYLWNSFINNAQIGDIKFSVRSNDYGYGYEQLPATADLELQGGIDFIHDYVNVTFTNTTEKILYGVFVVAAISDEDGNVIYDNYLIYNTVGIHPGSTVTMKLIIEEEYISYYTTHGIKLANIEALVYYRSQFIKVPQSGLSDAH